MTNYISDTKSWFELAVPTPTDKNRAVQIGVHFEEVSEMAEALNDKDLAEILKSVATDYKEGGTLVDLFGGDHEIDRKGLLDALCDQIVTAVGVAHMFGMNIENAMVEVNRSNFSKFVDGKPVFNEHGKIIKGPNYTPPDLTGFY